LEELGGAWKDFRKTETVLASLSLQKPGAGGASGACRILEERGAASEILEVSKGFAFLVPGRFEQRVRSLRVISEAKRPKI